MTPPIWRDEHGNPRPTRPCPRCGAITPITRNAPSTMQMLGWRPWGEAVYVDWCGHAVEVVLVPEIDG